MEDLFESFSGLPVVFYDDELEEKRFLSEIKWNLTKSPVVIVVKKGTFDTRIGNEVENTLRTITIASKLNYIKRTLFTSWLEIAEIIGVKERTIMKWKAGKAVPRERFLNSVEELYDFCIYLVSIFPEEKARRLFLYSENQTLKSAPIKLIKKGKKNSVLKVLKSMQETL
ncbi:MAG: hypothetical protein J7L62_00390 [Candidatus Aminicenantes bacterium]|nr:hypothetical protein [Candidatus Aminicenantes bacterium]